MKAKFVRELLEFDRGNPRDTLGVGARHEINKIIEDKHLEWWVKNDQDFLEYGLRTLGDERSVHQKSSERIIELGLWVGASIEHTIDETEAGSYTWRNLIPGIVKWGKISNDKAILEKLKQKIIDMVDDDINKIIPEKDSSQKRVLLRNLLSFVNIFSEAMTGSSKYPNPEYINKFKRQEKQMYVLDFIQRSKKPPTRIEVSTYSYQLSYGRGAKYSEGWGSTTFGSKGWIPRLTDKVPVPNSRAKGFILNAVGKWTLDELKKKYKSSGRKVPEKYELDLDLLDEVKSYLKSLPI